MQEKKPAISVIIPMYNTRAYVKECVDSVLAQTFRDFEVILVDDCSTDGSLALCRNLYGDNPRVAIYHHEKNGTVGAARNTGMKAAQGKYIAFLDSDDLYMPDALECLYRAAEEYQADVVHSPGCYLPNGDVEHITVEDVNALGLFWCAKKFCREKAKMGKLILYGRGLIAEEYCRYLEGQGRGADIAAFAVTSMNGQGESYCGRPCLEIGEALARFPEAEVHLSLQEKYHAEVIALLKKKGREPRDIIGLHRMTELLGEQGIREISAACPELTVQRNPQDYSMLEIFSPKSPERKFTFYPMTQVPLSDADVKNMREIVAKEDVGSPSIERKLAADEVYLAMATSQKDARVSMENLPDYVHPVMGGAAGYDGSRTADMAYDDEEADNISPYNNLYSELTVAHWLWKKAPKANYLGLCHYRRHFVLTGEICQALAEGTVDVLLTTPRLTFPNVHQYFADLPVTTMEEQDFQLMLRLIGREDSEIAKFSKDFLERQIHFPNNMLIAKRDVYLEYCSFMFKVLQGMQEHCKETGTLRPDRYLGYVGELLTTVYFAYHREKWRTGLIDYRLLKEV